MTKKITNVTLKRPKYSELFKEKALERAKKDGVAKTARDLGIAPAVIYTWIKKKEQTGIPFEDQKLQSAEMARLKREVLRLSEECAFLKKAAAYFAKEPT
jgi:transposase